MPFGELLPKKTTTDEAPVTTENNSDKQQKYIKPEVQEFHNNIIKTYNKTNEKNLQKVLSILETEL
jgi:hypothetical protein